MFIQIPYPFAPFLKYDPGEVPVILAAFAMGPVPALLVLFIKNIIHLVFKFNPGTMIGVIMNFFAGGAFAVTAGLVYMTWRTFRGALIGLILGVAVMTLVMIPMFLAGYPLFQKLMMPEVPLPDSRTLTMMAVGAGVPFNLIKGSLNSFLVLLIYKRISMFLKS